MLFPWQVCGEACWSRHLPWLILKWGFLFLPRRWISLWSWFTFFLINEDNDPFSIYCCFGSSKMYSLLCKCMCLFCLPFEALLLMIILYRAQSHFCHTCSLLTSSSCLHSFSLYWRLDLHLIDRLLKFNCTWGISMQSLTIQRLNVLIYIT